jgi:short-subunit dehydrogenase
MRDLTGRTAVVTGAVGGIGPHVVRALVAEGTNVVLASLPDPELETVASEARAAGVKALAVPTDVTDRSQREALIAAAIAELGGIDVLVNNAGIETTGAYHELNPATIERMIAVNLAAPMLLTWLVLPGMLERKRGHVVCMSSYVARSGPAYLEPYSATKGGLIGFTQSLRASYRRTGVSASVILPGVVEAGMYLRWKEESGLAAPRLLGTTTPEAVAKAVVRAVKRDLPEVLVTGSPARVVTTLGEASPRLAEWVRQVSGENDWLRKVAEARERDEAEGPR